MRVCVEAPCVDGMRAGIEVGGPTGGPPSVDRDDVPGPVELCVVAGRWVYKSVDIVVDNFVDSEVQHGEDFQAGCSRMLSVADWAVPAVRFVSRETSFVGAPEHESSRIRPFYSGFPLLLGLLPGELWRQSSWFTGVALYDFPHIASPAACALAN